VSAKRGRKAREKFGLFFARSFGKNVSVFRLTRFDSRDEIAAGVTGLSDGPVGGGAAKYLRNYAILHLVTFASPHFSLKQHMGTNKGSGGGNFRIRKDTEWHSLKEYQGAP